MKFDITAAAQMDLREIGAYIAKDNPNRAISFASELTAKIYQVGERPYSFPERAEWREGLRCALHGHYQILFVIRNERPLILRILHGTRNIPEII
jgi:toxin ParE1/3/4